MNEMQKAIKSVLISKGIKNIRFYKNKNYYVLKVDATNEQIQQVVRDLKFQVSSERISVNDSKKRIFAKQKRVGNRHNRNSFSKIVEQRKELIQSLAAIKIVVTPPHPKDSIHDLPDPNGTSK